MSDPRTVQPGVLPNVSSQDTRFTASSRLDSSRFDSNVGNPTLHDRLLTPQAQQYLESMRTDSQPPDAPLTWCLARLADDGSVMAHDLRYIVASHVLLNAGADARYGSDTDTE